MARRLGTEPAKLVAEFSPGRKAGDCIHQRDEPALAGDRNLVLSPANAGSDFNVERSQGSARPDTSALAPPWAKFCRRLRRLIEAFQSQQCSLLLI